MPPVDVPDAVQRQVLGVLLHQHVGQKTEPRQAAVDRLRRGRRDHDTRLARPAGVLGALVDDHLELRRHQLQHLAGLAADAGLRRPAGAGALRRGRLQPHHLARQRVRKRWPLPARRDGLAAHVRHHRPRRVRGRSVILLRRLPQLLQEQTQLRRVDLLRLAPEPVLQQKPQLVLQPVVIRGELGEDGDEHLERLVLAVGLEQCCERRLDLINLGSD